MVQLTVYSWIFTVIFTRSANRLLVRMVYSRQWHSLQWVQLQQTRLPWEIHLRFGANPLELASLDQY